MNSKLGEVDILECSCNIETVQDGRGAIFTWLPDKKIVEFDLLYFLPNKIRGNHYHPEFVEYFLVVEGSVVFVTIDKTGKKINTHASKGVCFRTPIGVPHAVHAITESLCVSFLTKRWNSCKNPIVYTDLVPFNKDYIDIKKEQNPDYTPSSNTGSVVKNVAVVGANGFVGSEIAKAVESSKEYNLIPVTRESDPVSLISSSDIVIYSANPAKRWMSEKYPDKDFNETVEKLFKFIELSTGKEFILISSLFCRTHPDTNYGRNRRACELLALNAGFSVIRLGPMFGGKREEDTLHDILCGRQVHVLETTKYAYVDVSWVGRKVVDLIGSINGIKEIGARNSIQLSELRDLFNSKSEFVGINDTQEPQDCEDGPDVNEVIDFMIKEEAKIHGAG